MKLKAIQEFNILKNSLYDEKEIISLINIEYITSLNGITQVLNHAQQTRKCAMKMHLIYLPLHFN